VNAGDVVWGMVLGYVLLGLVWLAAERIVRQRRVKRSKRVRARMSVVRPINAGRGRTDDVRPLRMGGNAR
jgi:hypothetical protein